MAGCCIRYASMDPTSDRAFPYSLSPTQSDGQTPPFHSTKSLLNAASMRGFTNRMYAVSPLPPSLPPPRSRPSALISTTVALVEGVAAKGDELRSVRRHRQEWRTQSMPMFGASRLRKTFLALYGKAYSVLSLVSNQTKSYFAQLQKLRGDESTQPCQNVSLVCPLPRGG